MSTPSSRYTVAVGISLVSAGLLVVLGLSGWWLWTNHWVSLSLVDAIGIMSPTAAASAISMLSDSDVFYFILADSPLYLFLMAVGGCLFAAGRIMSSHAG
jgi:hypothetical protein